MEVNSSQREFVEAARQYGLQMSNHQFAATKHEYDKIVGALRALRQSPDQGESFLLTCLSDPDPSVVTWAALYLLPYREHEAVQALSRVAHGDAGLVGLGAETTLAEWRAGRLTVE
jgi:hypothetical protein